MKASISAGVRRIEAITGEGALERFQEALAATSEESRRVDHGKTAAAKRRSSTRSSN